MQFGILDDTLGGLGDIHRCLCDTLHCLGDTFGGFCDIVGILVVGCLLCILADTVSATESDQTI